MIPPVRVREPANGTARDDLPRQRVKASFVRVVVALVPGQSGRGRATRPNPSGMQTGAAFRNSVPVSVWCTPVEDAPLYIAVVWSNHQRVDVPERATE